MLDIPDDPYNVDGIRGLDGAWMPAPSTEEANEKPPAEADGFSLLRG
jgi:hypothetical protein